jgi:hypothetical protein
MDWEGESAYGESETSDWDLYLLERRRIDS